MHYLDGLRLKLEALYTYIPPVRCCLLRLYVSCSDSMLYIKKIGGRWESTHPQTSQNHLHRVCRYVLMCTPVVCPTVQIHCVSTQIQSALAQMRTVRDDHVTLRFLRRCIYWYPLPSVSGLGLMRPYLSSRP